MSPMSGTNLRLVAVFVVGALVGAVSAVEVVPDFTPAATQEGASSSLESGNSGIVDAAGSPTDPVADDSSSLHGPQEIGEALPEPRSGLACAPGRNGGATDRGVTATEIKLATTVVESGIGAAFLRDVRFAMEAVRDEVNRAGGICGRRLVIDYIDDGWDAQRGAQFIRNFMDDVFAIPVGPSSEGLRVVIASGDVDKSKTPVVGADGLLIEQYVRSDGRAQPWVWPVAVATVGSARLMAQNAWKSGARSFGVVFDKNYRFGQEGAQAFNAEVKRLTGKPIEGFNVEGSCQSRYCGILAGKSSYSNEIREFYRGRVDYIALFLEPQTALTWMQDPNTPSAQAQKYGGAQPLFTWNFGNTCGQKCHQMQVWTGFKPHVESYKADPAVQRYVRDLKRTNPQADEFNAFAIGGYVGMKLLVEALRTVGPELTRERLKAALDTISLDTGLTFDRAIAYRSNLRFVTTKMRSYIIQYRGSFGGWREGPTEVDPRPTAGIH